MSIKSHGGIFGRNPTFNDVTVEGSISAPADSISGDAINGGTATLAGLTVDSTTLHVDSANNRVGVGTTTPATNIEISSDDVELRLTDTSGGYSDIRYAAGVLQIRADEGNNVAGSSMRFRIDGGEAMRFDDSKNLDMTNGGGNIKMASGAGIDFSATGDAGGMTSELFDDYEEGTWTATLSTGSGSITLESTINTLWYVKIGRVVHFGGRLSVDSVSTPSGDVFIRGWPFQQASLTGAQNSIHFSVGVTGPSSSLSPEVIVFWPENSDLARLRDNYGANPMADHFGASTNLYLNGSFLTN